MLCESSVYPSGPGANQRQNEFESAVVEAEIVENSERKKEKNLERES